MTKIFVGGFHHESDTFNPITTGKDDIKVRRGNELLEEMREDALKGIISYLKKEGYDLVLSLHARAVPNGEWDKDYYLALKDEFLNALKMNQDIAGICLALHGSMRVKEIGSAEEDLLVSIREICPKVPLFLSLDMHATITKKLLSLVDGIAGYKCAPHTDTVETGNLAAMMLDWAIKNKSLPFMSAYHIPFLIAGEKSETSTYPMNEIMAKLRENEKDDEILASSLLMGFPWADTTSSGVTAIVVTKTNKEKGEEEAKRIASEVWAKREKFQFCTKAYEMDEAIKNTEEAVESKEKLPLVLSDSGDNPTAGSSQDVTVLLKRIIESKILSKLEPPVLYQGLYDPIVVNEAFRVGKNGFVIGELGSLFDKVTSTPIKIAAKVKALNDYHRIKIALLDVNGVDVVVTEKHIGCYDVDMMRALTPIVEERKVIVVKLGYLEPEIKRIAKTSFLVLTPGSTNEVFSRLQYKNLKRPIYPLDKDCPENIEKFR